MLRAPPDSYIPIAQWNGLPYDQRPLDHVPIIIGRLWIDKTVIGYVSMQDVLQSNVAVKS